MGLLGGLSRRSTDNSAMIARERRASGLEYTPFFLLSYERQLETSTLPSIQSGQLEQAGFGQEIGLISPSQRKRSIDPSSVTSPFRLQVGGRTVKGIVFDIGRDPRKAGAEFLKSALQHVAQQQSVKRMKQKLEQKTAWSRSRTTLQ